MCRTPCSFWSLLSGTLIANRIGIGFGLLVVTVKVQARYVPVSLVAHCGCVSVKTANLTEQCCAGLISALNVVGLEVPVEAARIESRVLVGIALISVGRWMLTLHSRWWLLRLSIIVVALPGYLLHRP